MELSDIKKIFEAYGKPKRMYLSRNSHDRDYTYAFIEFDYIEQVQAAINDLNGTPPYKFKLSFRLDKDDRPSKIRRSTDDKFIAKPLGKESSPRYNARAVTDAQHKPRICKDIGESDIKPKLMKRSSRDDVQTTTDTHKASCRKDALSKTEEILTTSCRKDARSKSKETQTTSCSPEVQTNTNIPRKKLVYNYLNYPATSKLYTPEQNMAVEKWVDETVEEANEGIDVPFMPGKCAYCFRDSINMCSICKTFYCDRVCAQTDWPKHSAECISRDVKFSDKGHIKFSGDRREDLKLRIRTKSENRGDIPDYIFRSERFDSSKLHQDENRINSKKFGTNRTGTTPIPTDRYTLVYVLYIDDFSYWVAKASCLEIMQDITKLIQEHCSDPDILCDPTLKHKCCAPYEGEMYRAKILSKTESTAIVRFVDYGNKHEVPLDQIKCVNSRLSIIKPIAFEIKFIESSMNEIYAECFYYFKAVEMKDGACIVELKHGSEPLSASSPTELPLSAADLKRSDDVHTKDKSVAELKEGSEQLSESRLIKLQPSDDVKRPRRITEKVQLQVARRLWQAAFKTIQPIKNSTVAHHKQDSHIISESMDLDNSDTITSIKVGDDVQLIEPHGIIAEPKPTEDLECSDTIQHIKIINDPELIVEPEVIPEFTEVVLELKPEVIPEINDIEEINYAELEEELQVIQEVNKDELETEPEVIPVINEEEHKGEPEILPESKLCEDLNNSDVIKPTNTINDSELESEPKVTPVITEEEIKGEPQVIPEFTEVVLEAKPEVIPEINDIDEREAEVFPESKPSDDFNASNIINPSKITNYAELEKELQVIPEINEDELETEPEVIPVIREEELIGEPEILPESKLSDDLNNSDVIKPTNTINDSDLESEPKVTPVITEEELKGEPEMLPESKLCEDLNNSEVVKPTNTINDSELESEHKVTPVITEEELKGEPEVILELTEVVLEAKPEVIPGINDIEDEREAEVFPESKPSEDFNASNIIDPSKITNYAELEKELQFIPEVNENELESEPEVIPVIHEEELKVEPEMLPESKLCEDLNNSEVVKPTNTINDSELESEHNVTPVITEEELKGEPEVIPELTEVVLETKPEVIPEINDIEDEREAEVFPESKPSDDFNASNIINPSKITNYAELEKELQVIPEVNENELESEPEVIPVINEEELKGEPEILPESKLCEDLSNSEVIKPTNTINDSELETEPKVTPVISEEELKGEPEILPESKLSDDLNNSDVIKPTNTINDSELQTEPEVIPVINEEERKGEPEVIPEFTEVVLEAKPEVIPEIYDIEDERVAEVFPESKPSEDFNASNIIDPSNITNYAEFEKELQVIPKINEDELETEPEVIPKSMANENSKSSHKIKLIKTSNDAQIEEGPKLVHEFKLTEVSESVQCVHNMSLLHNINAAKTDMSLKSKPLSSDKFVNVKIIFNEGQNQYWVVLEKRFSELHLISSMDLNCEKLNKIHDPIWNKLCMVSYEGEWCRAKVTKLNPLTVFYIDYGNSDLCRMEEMFELPFNLRDIPPMAIRIKLAPGTPLHFYNLEPLNCLKVKAVCELADNYYLVEVTDASEEQRI